MIYRAPSGLIFFGGTLGGVTPPSGQIAMSDINGAFQWGNDLNAYRGRQWFTPQGASGNFPSGQIAFSDFYNKQPNSPVVPGSIDFTDAGYHEMNIPYFNWFRVQVWGGGAGGGAGQGKNQAGTDGNPGGNSTILDVAAYGGQGGKNGPGYRSVGAGGPGGGAAGGNEVNEQGGGGQNGSTKGGDGGAGARGGGGGAGAPGASNRAGNNGGWPGGAGGGGNFDDGRGGWVQGGGGGGGGYSQKIWYAGQLAPGQRIGLTVGGGGGGGNNPFGGGRGGNGERGRILVSWG